MFQAFRPVRMGNGLVTNYSLTTVFERWAFFLPKNTELLQFDGQFTVQVTLPKQAVLYQTQEQRVPSWERSHIPLPFRSFEDYFPFYQDVMRSFPVWVLVSCLKPRHLNQQVVSLSCKIIG